MNNDKVRISDIAQELGLSTATVSNVIHGKTDKVSTETIKRVQELLEKRAYIPSMAGILLARNNSRIIGVMINDHEKYEGHPLEDGYISSALNALSREIDLADFFMMIKVTTDLNEIIRFASMWNMEGMVVMGFCEQDYQRLRESMHIPFVVYDGSLKEYRGICNLTIDNYDGGCQVGSYLKSMGHDRVLCIADNFTSGDLKRMQGCADALGKASVPFMQIPFSQKERIDFYHRHLNVLLKYTAVFAASDLYAIELICFLQNQRIRVPQELSVVGFDDSPLCKCCNPALTTVSQDVYLKARKALSLLQALKSNPEEGSALKLPVSLIRRQSVKDLNSDSPSENILQ